MDDLTAAMYTGADVLHRNNCKPYRIELVDHPIQAVIDSSGKKIAYLVMAPIYTNNKQQYDMIASFKEQGYPILGIMSHLSYPLDDQEEYNNDCRFFSLRHETFQTLLRTFDGWLHCLPLKKVALSPHIAAVPHMLFSESDMTNIEPFHDTSLVKKYDIIYMCNNGAWHKFTKGWRIAKKCFARLAAAIPDIRILIIGLPAAESREDEEAFQATYMPYLPWGEYRRRVQEAYVQLFPQIHDASPRALAEALCIDVPVIVNRNIVGGWKYVVPETGAFFDGEDDIVDVYRGVRSMTGLCPRKWFTENYGPQKSGMRLRAFLEHIARQRVK